MSTIVIRKARARVYTLTHYAPGLDPAPLIEVRTRKQARELAEWCQLRFAQYAANVKNPAFPFFAA